MLEGDKVFSEALDKKELPSNGDDDGGGTNEGVPLYYPIDRPDTPPLRAELSARLRPEVWSFSTLSTLDSAVKELCADWSGFLAESWSHIDACSHDILLFETFGSLANSWKIGIVASVKKLQRTEKMLSKANADKMLLLDELGKRGKDDSDLSTSQRLIFESEIRTLKAVIQDLRLERDDALARVDRALGDALQGGGMVSSSQSVPDITASRHVEALRGRVLMLESELRQLKNVTSGQIPNEQKVVDELLRDIEDKDVQIRELRKLAAEASAKANAPRSFEKDVPAARGKSIKKRRASDLTDAPRKFSSGEVLLICAAVCMAMLLSFLRVLWSI